MLWTTAHYKKWPASSADDVTAFERCQDDATFTGRKQVFAGASGPIFPMNGETPLSILEKIWDQELMSLLVHKTNRYAHQFLTEQGSGQSRMTKWQDIDLGVFFDTNNTKSDATAGGKRVLEPQTGVYEDATIW